MDLNLDNGRPSTRESVAVTVEVGIPDFVVGNVPYWLSDGDLMQITEVTIRMGFSALGRIHSLVPGRYVLAEFQAYVEIWGSYENPSAQVNVSGGSDPKSLVNFYHAVLLGKVKPDLVLGKSFADMYAARMAELELRLAVAHAEGGTSSSGDDTDG